MNILPEAFEALNSVKQFIVYTLKPRESNSGKMDKIPVDYRTGFGPVNPLDPKIWVDSLTAIEATKKLGPNYGIGFVFTEKDNFWFLDIDDCLESPGNWSSLAHELANIFPGAAIEVSSSGKGLHIIGSGKPPLHACRNINLKIEFYTKDRFVALTGIQANGSASLDFSEVLPSFVEKYFSRNNDKELNISEWTTEPCLEWRGPIDDDELIKKAISSQSISSMFVGKASFRDLFEANAEKLSVTYPGSQDKGYDESSADAALAQHLAFWTGKNCERIRNIMFKSELKREKWDREDYLYRTIINVCKRQKVVFGSKLSTNEYEQIPDTNFDELTFHRWNEVSIRDIFTNPSEPPKFLIEDLVPEKLLTLLAAHGGTGKSMLALQMAVCLAMNISFMGKKTVQSRVIFYSAEDSTQVVRHRLAKICRIKDLNPEILAENLKILDATNNPCLYSENTANKNTQETAGCLGLGAQLRNFNADVLIVDNTSDTFDANENNRAHVRGFLRKLLQLVEDKNIAVLLLAHVDKQTAKGEMNTQGYSGSTAFHNSARSRLYLISDESNRLILKHQKSNHGKISEDIVMIWSSDGILIETAPVSAQVTRDAILCLIKKYTERGNYVSTAPTSPSNPFKILRNDPDFPFSIRNSQELRKLLDKAEDDGLLQRRSIKAKRPGETREIFDLSPTALTMLAQVSTEGTNLTPRSVRSTTTGVWG